MRIVHASDLHFGAEDPALVAAFHAWFQRQAPDMLIVSGDVTQYGERREFDAVRRFFESLKAPVILCVPGNHDTPFVDMPARLAAPFARYQKYLGEVAVDRHVSDAVAVAGLNTARGVQWRMDWSLGVVNAGDLQRALDWLDQQSAGGWKLLVCHHPLLTPSISPFPVRTHGGGAAAQAVAEAGVDLVLSGHTHMPTFETLVKGEGRTRAITAGTAFSRRTRGEPASFNVLELSRTSMSHCVHRWDASARRFVAGAVQEAERAARHRFECRDDRVMFACIAKN